MLALLDGDILCYRIGFSTEDESPTIALYRLDKYIDDITFGAEASDYKVYLTDSRGNYRNAIYPDYKANRAKLSKPSHYQIIKDYLINHEAAIVATGQEADDALGIEQTLLGDESIICSIDKDMLMIPGWHYNFVKRDRIYITPEIGIRKFYTQILTGDPVDNIPGLKGIGPKKAGKILEDCTNEQEFKVKVFDAYKERHSDLPDEEIRSTIERNGRLLWIRRHQNELWCY